MSAPRFTKEQKAAIVARYLAIGDSTEIAKDFGCDPSYPALLAKRRGHKPRSLVQAVGAHWTRKMKREAEAMAEAFEKAGVAHGRRGRT